MRTRITAPCQPQETRKGTWESAGLHPTGEFKSNDERNPTTPILQYSITPVLHRSMILSRHDSVRLLALSLSPSLQYSITPILQYSITPLLHHSITPLLHYSSFVPPGQSHAVKRRSNSTVKLGTAVLFSEQPGPWSARSANCSPCGWQWTSICFSGPSTSQHSFTPATA